MNKVVSQPYESPEAGMYDFSYDAEEPVEEVLKDVGDVSDSTKLYLRQIGKIPLLNAEREVELSKDMEAGLLAGTVLRLKNQQDAGEILETDETNLVKKWLGKAGVEALHELERRGDDAKNAMLNANLRLVVSLAKRYSGRGIDLLDLVQLGNEGLIRAVEKFDYAKGYKFSTYATWWIRQALTRGIADTARTIRVPVHMAEKLNRFKRTKSRLEQTLQRHATIDELAAELDVSAAVVKEYFELSRVPTSLDVPVSDSGGVGPGQKETVLSDLIEDDKPEVAEQVTGSFLKEELLNIISLLSKREAQVITMRYGLDNGEPKTLMEVGAVLGVTRERVRQLEAKALKKLRHPGYSAQLKDYL